MSDLGWEVPPSAINDCSRLFMGLRKDFGPEVLDNAESFDKVFGAGRFAKTDRLVLDMVRRCIENAPDHIVRADRRMVKKVEQKRSDGE